MLLKYLRLYRAFFKASFVADLEYRANFITRIFTDIFWYLAQIITFETLYRHMDKIGDWSLPQTRVFLGVLFVVDAIYMIVFHDNLDQISERVRKGELDLLLAKPVNSQFMLSTQRVSTALFGNLMIGMSWLIYSLSQIPTLPLLNYFWFLALIPAGLVAIYSVRFGFCTMSLLFTRAENIQYMWFQIYKLGMRPDSIYFPWVRFLLVTVLPVGFVASIPSRALMEPANHALFLWVILWSCILLYLSHRWWNWCLKHYSSASS